MDVDVDRAGDGGNLFHELLGNGEVALAATDDLDVDGRGQAEVKDLVGDVGGGEEEGAVRELLAEVGSKEAHVLLGVALAWLERDQNLAIRVGDGGAVREGEVDAAGWQADVVEDELYFIDGNNSANFLFDGGEVLLGVFEPQTFGGIDVEAHLPGVDVGEEVLPDEEQHRKRGLRRGRR